MFCSQCGGRLSLTARFCEECGAPRDQQVPLVSSQAAPATMGGHRGGPAVGLKPSPPPGAGAIQFNPNINVNVASQGPAAPPAVRAAGSVTVINTKGVHPIMAVLWCAFLALWLVAIGVTTNWSEYSGLLMGLLLWLALFQHLPPLMVRPRHTPTTSSTPAQAEGATQRVLLARAVLVLAGFPLAAMWILSTHPFDRYYSGPYGYTSPNIPVGIALLVSFVLFNYVWAALARRMR